MESKGSRMTIQREDGHERDFGKITTLSLGYGLHQAWVYASMFGTVGIFGLVSNGPATEPSSVFVISILVYALCLLLFALFDQRLLPLLVERSFSIAAVGVMVVGTLLILLSSAEGALGAAATLMSGVLTGLGSSVLILLWGTAFSRHSSATIIVNSALSIFIAMLVYAVILHLLEPPASGIVASLLPLVEVAVLWKQMPKSYIKRREVPVFNPLPINKGVFFLLIGLPMLLFGLVLGFMREQSIVLMMPRISISSQLPFLFASGLAAVIIVLAGFAIIDDDRGSALLRPLLPIVAISIFLIPLANTDIANATWSVAVVTGYMCFEGLLWILMGTISQRYRISPVLVFGIGRGSIALGVFFSFVIGSSFDALSSATGYNEVGNIAIMLVALIGAFALMPHESDIRRAVILASDGNQTFVDMLNIYSEGDNKAESRASQDDSKAATDGASDDAQNEEKPDEGKKSSEEKDGGGQSRQGGLFRKKCERVANRYLLSTRETEVLFYLAKGHNAAFLQEKLYISEGTAKTHIRHIYGKTNVHNQQELMRLVSDEWID